MTNKIEEIASVHLGKAGDGSIVKPYVTPDNVDSKLLVAIPRRLNREQYQIDEFNLPFVGTDAWNCYEFSTLLKNGFPVSGWVKLTYSATSEYIVESKSLKLYLNSYNMARLIDNIHDIDLVTNRISVDITKIVGEYVDVGIMFDHEFHGQPPITGTFHALEEICTINTMLFTDYNESKDILQVVASSTAPQNFRSYSLRSNCRVTNQPDWGDVYIHILGAKTVTPESLLRYIVSMRKENHFHEEICEAIYKRLYDLLNPVELFVGCLYTRRGGIDINPMRATDYKLLDRYAKNICDPYIFCQKTMRQ